ncbi:hypothetical protein D915_003179 [Fasciola hepatica]|uniref:Uncharacterized protein n=1 Tax=Fasciola hepatica TaxID=6192 RepID=A0A4E0RF25_FASHE|nr:hypothetical protein D915_003179 [Fasciola hepatica]
MVYTTQLVGLLVWFENYTFLEQAQFTSPGVLTREKAQISLENEAFENYTHQHLAHHFGKRSAQDRRQGSTYVKLRGNGVRLAGQQKLTLAEKCIVLESEITRMQHKLRRMKVECEVPINNYTANIEETEIRRTEIPALLDEFKQNVVLAGYDKRIGAVTTEHLLRYQDICMTRKETQINRLLVDSSLKRIKMRQMRWSIRQRRIWRAAFTPLEYERMRLLHRSAYREYDEMKVQIGQQRWIQSRLRSKLAEFKRRIRRELKINEDITQKLLEAEKFATCLSGRLDQVNQTILKVHEELWQNSQRLSPSLTEEPPESTVFN